MGHYYPWASPWAVDELTFLQLELYLGHVPELEYRRQFGLIRIRRQIEAFNRSLAGEKGGELPEWEGEFPSWARGRELGEDEPPPYSEALVKAFSFALSKGLISNKALRNLDTEKLRKSGWR